MPDLNALARDSSSSDLVKLGRLVLGIVLRSERAGDHIQAIQSLDIEDQQQLMVAIEHVMSSLETIGEEEDGAQGQAATEEDGEDVVRGANSEESAVKLRSEKEAIEKLYLELMESHRTLQANFEDKETERSEAVKELARYREEIEEKRQLQADVLMRQDIERLKEELRRSEDNLAEAESEVERLTTLSEEVTRKNEDLQKKAEEGVRLKDQMDEYRHVSEKLQRTENVIEKYKRKLEEGADIRRQLKILEEQNAELIDKNAQIEDEYKRVAAFKPLMDSYKTQIADLEGKTSDLQRDLNAARYDQEQTSTKLRATEEARAKEKEEMELYQERITELELGGTGKRRKPPLTSSDSGDVNGVEGLAKANETSADDDDDLVDEVDLEDALEGTSLTGLKIQIRRLKRDLEAAQANKADASRLLVVENLLEDANKLKGRYEEDYLREHQAKLVLQSQFDEIQSGKSNLGDGPEANYALRLRLNETVDELDQIKRREAELKVQHEQVTKELNIAKSDLNLVDKDKIDIVAELRARVDAEKADIQREMDGVKKRLGDADEQNRMQLSQLNSLLMDKVDWQATSLLKSTDSTDGEAAQKLKERFNKARSFIREQDKIISQLKRDAADVGKGAPDEVVARAKRAEEENALLKQEQRLMASAWFHVNARLQREVMSNSASHRNGPGSRSSAANALANANAPRSWLGQQRRSVTAGIPLSRR